MSKFLLAASVAWPVLLGAGWWSAAHDGPPWLTAATYLVAGRVCHQKPERSFWSAGVPAPVCGRCTGLYVSAPIGALAAFATRRRRSSMPSLGWLIAAAIPTAATFALEKLGVMAVSNTARLLAALPLGAATAFVVMAVTERSSRSDRIN